LTYCSNSTTEAASDRRSNRRSWRLAWFGGIGIGVANGVARETTYGKRVPELTAHQISTLMALIAFAGYFDFLERRWPLDDRRQALSMGMFWAALTVGFEFGFGRLVAKNSWSELTADYDLRRGRVWPVVLAWLAIGPELTRQRHAGPLGEMTGSAS
jgi:hypothetical protein